MRPAYQNRDYLYQKHIVERLTAIEIGKLHGVGGNAVFYWLHKRKICVIDQSHEKYAIAMKKKMNLRANRLLNLIEGNINTGELLKKYNETWQDQQVCLKTITRDINTLAELGRIEKREIFNEGHTTIITKTED